MKAAKRKRLERSGGRLVSTEEFLELSEQEIALVEIRLDLADAVEGTQEEHRRSQGVLTKQTKQVARG